MTGNTSPRRAYRYQREAARWAKYAAPRLRLSPLTVEADVHGVKPSHLRVACYIEAARALGDEALVEKIMAPIRRALSGAGRPANLTALEIEEEALDAVEGVLQIRFALAKGPDERRQLARERIHNIDRYTAKLSELRARLVEDFELA